MEIVNYQRQVGDLTDKNKKLSTDIRAIEGKKVKSLQILDALNPRKDTCAKGFFRLIFHIEN